MYGIVIDRTSDETLYRQLYRGLTDGIKRGRPAGTAKLPSSRDMAAHFGISRTVVLSVYDQLLAEGYTVTRSGSGTYVVPGLVASASRARPRGRTDSAGHAPGKTNGADRAAPVSTCFAPLEEGVIDFRSGLPDLRRFPRSAWQKSITTVLKLHGRELLSYGPPEGVAEVREAISEYLLRQRGIDASPERIVMTAGTTQAIGLVTRLLLARGRGTAVTEDPVTRDIPRIIAQHGGSVIGVTVDEDGLCTERLPDLRRAAFVYVTPSHQFPMGSVLTMSRRVDLVARAIDADTFIVEDDYDSEFRYHGPPLSPLFGLNPDRVLYIGTFSKTLAPGLRMAFLILPPRLMDRARELKWLTDLHNPVMEQLTLAHFLSSGAYYRHLRAMRNVYREKRAFLLACLAGALKRPYRVLGTQTGIHIILAVDGLSIGADWLERMRAERLALYPVDRHRVTRRDLGNALILGYGHLELDEIEHGVGLLAAGLEVA